MTTPAPGCAVVTGAGGGIGAAVAQALAREGWRLLLTDRDRPALDRLQADLAAAGAEADIYPADITREEDVAAVISHAAAQPGGLCGFVAAAGTAGVAQALPDYPADAFRQVLDVNVFGTCLCLKLALTAMRDGGSFVAVGSTSSIRGRANLAGYVASKHAVLGLVRTAALEQVGTAVRVNAVLPGPTQTAMIDAINDMAAKRVPDGGKVERAVAAPMATPDQVADTIVFLLSPASRHLNGSAIVVDGGSTLA